jgi:hypothetical protein
MAHGSDEFAELETPAGLKSLMAEWKISTRLEQRRLRLKYKIPTLSRFLYKYQGFGGQYAVNNLRNLIVRSRFRLNAPSTFNDPYEFNVDISLQSTEEQRLRRFTQLVAERAPAESKERQAEMVADLMARPDSEHIKRCQESLERIKHQSGVLCFAGDPRSLLMWSHYAENHEGVCLQFERIRDFPVLGHAVHVDYQERFPKANWIVDFMKGVGEMLLTKHDGWRYEEECRITSIDNANRYLQVRPDALRAIIFGCRTSESNRKTVDGLLKEREALGAPAVKRWFAVKHPSQYQIIIRRNANLTHLD